MTKTKKIFVIIFSVLIAFTIAGFYAINRTGYANVEALKSEYSVGETVTIPDKTIQGVNADKIVIFPSGTARKTNEVTLTEAGVYTVEYRAVSGGNIYTETADFLAIRGLYSFSGTKSIAEYGVDNSQYNSGRTSLNVKLAQGEKMTFEQVFNINEFSGEFLKFYVTPEKKGTLDAQGIWIYVTDVADPNNFIKIKFQSVQYNGQPYVYIASYVLAAHNEEVISAYNGDAAIRRNDRFGVGCYLSLYGNGGDYAGVRSGTGWLWGIDAAEAYARFVYDASEKQLFVGDSRNQPSLVVDFDDVKFFDNIWAGFSTGDVRVSVEAYGYTGQFFNINFMSVGDINLARESVRDEEAPEISINYGDYAANNLPDCVVGKSYGVFNATAYDKYDGMLEPTVNVIFAEGSETALSIPVKDGRFKTDYEGKYTIVYTATDKSGNASVKKVTIVANNSSSAMSVDLSDGDASCKVGEKIVLKTAIVSGEVGNKNITISIDKKNIFDKNTNTMIPLETGTFTVTYVVSDFVGNKITVGYTIDVEANDKPVVMQKVSLPKYAIAGLKMQFPSVIAHDFSTDVDIQADVYVNGTKCTDGEYTPERTLIGQNVSVEYRVNESKVYPTAGEITLKILDLRDAEDYVNYLGYFVANGINTEMDDTGVIFTAESDGNVEYAKDLLFGSSFSTTFAFNPNKANFRMFSITFTDANDTDSSVVLGLVKNEEKGVTEVYVNGEKTSYVISKGGFYSLSQLQFVYQDEKLVNLDNGIRIDISDFKAEKIYISYSFAGVTGTSDIKLVEVNGQPFRNDPNMIYDTAAPQFALCGEYDSIANLNDEITVWRAVVCDILDTEANVVVSVTDPSGRAVISKVNADTDYKVALTQYGKYKITYFISDGSYEEGNPWTKTNGASYDFFIVCHNTVKPEISLESELSAQFSVGDTVVIPNTPDGYSLKHKTVLPKAVAIDDIEGEVEVSYFILEPVGNLVCLNDKNCEYTFKLAGNYALRLFAMDGSGNIAIKDVYFRVVD